MMGRGGGGQVGDTPVSVHVLMMVLSIHMVPKSLKESYKSFFPALSLNKNRNFIFAKFINFFFNCRDISKN